MTADATVTSSLAAPLLRVTARRADQAEIRHLSDLTAPSLVRSLRVRRALALLAAFRGLRRDQLEALLLVDEPLARASRRVMTHRVVAELRQRGLLDELLAAGSPSRVPWRAYALTAAGEEAYARRDGTYPAQRSRRPASVLRLAHAMMLADIALALWQAAIVAGDIDLLWESDWQLAARIGSRAPLPDAFVTIDRGGWRTQAFIEADRSTEWVTAFSRKVRAYVDLYRADLWRPLLGAWPLVLTVTTSDRHARTLAETALRVAQQEGGGRIAHAFRFTSVDDLRRGDPYGAIWLVGGRDGRAPFLGSDRRATIAPVPHASTIGLDSSLPASPSRTEKLDGSILNSSIPRHKSASS